MSTLLSKPNANTKMAKTNLANGNYLTTIMHLAPHKVSGYNTCPNASLGCIATCLNTAGLGVYSNVQQARINKTLAFYNNRETYLNQLSKELLSFERKCLKLGIKPAIRLNGTSDLPWEKFDIIQKFPGIQFYDYTKSFSRMSDFLSGNFPSNYYLTFSRSEVNEDKCMAILRRGGNVAVVFYKNLPNEWKGYPVINGDNSDLRFLDNGYSVVGLIAKGKARKDMTGFVVR